MILENGVPLFQDNFVGPGTSLSCNQFFEVSNGIVFIAFDPLRKMIIIFKCGFYADFKAMTRIFLKIRTSDLTAATFFYEKKQGPR